MAFAEGFPPGFYTSVEYLHEIPDNALLNISRRVAKTVAKIASKLNVEDAAQLITDEGGEMGVKGVEAIINTVDHIFRVCLRDGIEAKDIVKGLRSKAAFGDVQAKAVATAWHEAVTKAKEDSGENTYFDMLSIGKLKDVKCSMGVAVSSSTVKTLKIPIVNMRLTVVKPSGEEVVQTLELTVDEYRDFAKKAREAVSVFDAL
mmetsp:Transcript_46352/g.119620  ORF Transcript_46352/g.119620 Transcript_46352/m.119620 type:complete len:203 (-) Transcript_46352:375-983(-)|eukprot:CAMPEP_0113904540 /NCGR_PEP_ID=MMETSP0780_2-20120614/23325_1 /TAXON_ID=652834 /ORGANISM="Palpitomonas bilix" /LENGTH=202 /DNA_ID=CAMNT_0000898193 /DNA_START=144 /DNA_END=752 /DNA_ORIENTATION=- /assembly_acc=CAM_ASM_000599